ncbi:AAA family ATPase [Agromyces sp. LHK192]|uniref:ATP-binding protein n=1 Tax=Agromyces sp. LHK192 TaxID=2498704 RepID=UPI000FDCD04B|nr:LuxR family transcriptional regulator [Agromyces sp. LHK192]
MGERLLERESALAEVRRATDDARDRRGSLVLLHGEAGIGKSAVVAAIRAEPPQGFRVLVGACDAMSTPRTLGPFRDLATGAAELVAGPLADALREADREAVFAALIEEFRDHPTVLVVEDAHWADEATLDVVRFLARRIDVLPVVFVVTYRDELERDHPLSQVLGDIGHGANVHRVALPRLTPSAVAALTAERGLDAARIYDVTGGNPYFVSELVASAGGPAVPPTVVEAVTGRLRRLDVETQAQVELLATIPFAVGPDLLARLVPAGVGALRSAEEAGILVVTPGGVGFRHELTRHAVLDALAAARRIQLERRVLAALEADAASGIDVDPGRLVHHAVEAGDVDAIVRHAPNAGADAAASGAHRQAVAHYAAALEHPDRFDPARLATLLERSAVEQYTVGGGPAAVARQEQALELRRALGDPIALGAGLRWLSRFAWFAGDRAGAERAASEASAVLEHAGDTGLYAMALSNESQLAMLAHDVDTTVELATRAIELAEAVDDPGTLSHALNNLGTALMFQGRGGEAELLRAAAVALERGDMENAARAHINIVWSYLDDFRLDEAERELSRAMDLTERAEFLGLLTYQRMEEGRLLLARARWEDALAAVDRPLESLPHARCVALTVAGTVGIRRGDPGAEAVLEEAAALADELAELQRTGPVAAARAESALLRGDVDAARAVATPAYEESRRLGARNLSAELAALLRRAGSAPPAEPGARHPFATEAWGDAGEAARRWRSLGCPYHEASALAQGGDDDLLAGLAIADRLGAAPLARMIRAELGRRGVRGVPRGPQEATRRNPEGLTDRQVDVLRLVETGLTNAQIAERLVLSVRTVDSHLQALFAKLGVTTRREAARRAVELGVATGAPGAVEDADHRTGARDLGTPPPRVR